MKGLYRVARRAILSQLKASAEVTAIVGAEIHGQGATAATWPFIILGLPQVIPIKGTCLDGGTVNTQITGFARARKVGQSTVETGEDHASRLGAAIERALDDTGQTMTVDGKPARVRHRLADMRLFPDRGEPGAFQYSATIRTRIVAE